MATALTHLLIPEAPVTALKAYEAQGGLDGLRKARAMAPAQVIAAVSSSNLRGRGGAGFPTGKKWKSVAEAKSPTRYVVANAAEGEPATFKDRWLLRRNPHAMLEGLLIAAHAVSAQQAFIGIKRSFKPETARLRAALAQWEQGGQVSRGFVEVVGGPEDYLFGEEKALLEVIDGRRPLPRVLPPYVQGLRVAPHASNPAVVNNVETLSHVPAVLRHGPEWFRRIGPPHSPGTILCTLCGDVERPGLYELPMGTPLRTLLETCGGGPSGTASFKAVCSGAANAVITPSQFDTPLEFDAMRNAGTGLGAAGFVAYDAQTCMVRVALTFSRFLARESCGQCTACTKGCQDITALLERLERGQASQGALERLLRHCDVVDQGRRCYLPVQEQVLIRSLVQAFREEFTAHLRDGCRSRKDVVLPLIKDWDEARRRFVMESGGAHGATTSAAGRPA